MLPSQKPSYHFDAKASYVISGGTGGLGRSMARWMVRRGARNIILLSRSGDSSEKAKELLVELKAEGAQVVAPSCDVTDHGALSNTLRQCLSSMPPIKGCIQGSMVLKVGVARTCSE
jgi:NAD(P)-dependent dehydrogenase (short-subunit alcohol dehydrogenase family)